MSIAYLKGTLAMTPEAIIALYDRNINMTLAQLSRLTGWHVSELKTLLLET